MSARLILRRDGMSPDKPTTGTLYLDAAPIKTPICSTLELPWVNNKAGVSCIPVGTYRMEWHPSPRLRKQTWRLMNVPGRDGILIHTANFDRQLRGCIAPGLGVKDIDGDGRLDVTASGAALVKLERILAPYLGLGIDIAIESA